MRLFLAAFTLLFATQQAAALSCIRPDVARSYQQAAEADETYVVLYGRLAFDASKLPKGGGVQPPSRDRAIRLPAQFEGYGLNKDGFVVPLDRPVVIEAQCWASWCGGLTPGAPGLAFAERSEGTYIVQVDPCGTKFFPDPGPEILDQAVACMQGRDCTPN